MKLDIVIDLALQRVPPRVIAHRLNLPREKVYTVLQSARRNGLELPRFSCKAGNLSPGPTRTVLTETTTLDALVPHATKRGWSVNALCRLLLQAIADEQLVDAVLDDHTPVSVSSMTAATPSSLASIASRRFS